MTPLLWAFPDRKLERFECLLRHGADPKVRFQSDFGLPYTESFYPHAFGEYSFRDPLCRVSESVVNLAARSPEPEYANLIVKYGGDPRVIENLRKQR
jgi:hypothetical protein